MRTGIISLPPAPWLMFRSVIGTGNPRPAVTADTDELVRLRTFLLSSGPGHYVARNPEEERAWQRNYRVWLSKVLPAPDGPVRVTVIDGPSGLAACAIAVVDQRAPTHLCPGGEVGWVQTVVVDPAMRRHGLGRRIMRHVLEWFREREIRTVFLQTTPDAADLYKRIGFRRTGEDTMVAEIPAAQDRASTTID
ncbi:GNAT family N-acetyltransferase [Streptomyces sp. T-3]|nr:GNAT family N-acetyltransferase [Streptomyces sp. T-3]